MQKKLLAVPTGYQFWEGPQKPCRVLIAEKKNLPELCPVNKPRFTPLGKASRHWKLLMKVGINLASRAFFYGPANRNL